MWKLYEIDSLLREAVIAAEARIDESGELPDDWAEFLNDLQMERDKKALGVAAIIRELKAEAEAIDIERKRITMRQRAVANRADSLRSYLSTYLSPGEKLKDTCVSIGWTKSSRVEIGNIMEIPDRFCRVERLPMLREIAEAIKSGDEVTGARVVESQAITIR